MTEIVITITRKELIAIANARAARCGLDVGSLALVEPKRGYTFPSDRPTQVLPVYSDDVEDGDDPLADGWCIDGVKIMLRLKEESDEGRG